MIAFTPTGPLLSFTGATTAPTSVQAISLDGVGNQQYCLTNTDSTNDCIVGYGTTDIEAKLAAAAGATTTHCYYLLRGTQVMITGVRNAFFTGIAAAGSPVIKVQNGYGS